MIESASDSGVVQRMRRKRQTVKNDSCSDTEAVPGAKCHTARRGRPPKTRGSGSARARKEQRQRVEKAREEEYDFERNLSDWAQQHRSAQTSDVDSVLEEDRRKDTSVCSAEELRTYAGKRAASILEVATKSGHLKGTYVRKLKEAAAAFTEIIEALVSRTESDELRLVREENRRLTVEVSTLRSELQDHSKDVQNLRLALADAQKSTPPVQASTVNVDKDALEALKRSIVKSVGTMIDARFAGIEDRLLPVRPLRPPLAHERRQRPMATPKESETDPDVRHRQKRKKTTERYQAPIVRVDVPLAGPQSDSGTCNISQVTVAEDMEEESESWTAVVRKGKKSATNSSVVKTKTLTIAKRQPRRPKVAKQPKTMAVMITLTTDAVAKGVSYAQALERAQQGVNLVQLGITEGLTVRQAMSGARLLELSAAHSSEQADMLAERLRVVLDGVAVVTRPHKNASLRLVGLDDSVTKEKLITAVANTGCCPVNAITVSELLLGPRRMMSAVVRCPCDSAKTIVDKGRILVGWSSAKVQVLEERPMRCFKCLSLGHTRPRCPSAVVREHLCFRCGCEGHKFHTCRAEPRCMVCTDAKIPAGHIMGSADCRPPPIKGTESFGIEVSRGDGGCQGQEDSVMS